MNYPHNTPTRLLQAMQAGERDALEPFLRTVMTEMRRRARCLLVKERAGHTLQETSLINEAFLRLFDGKPVPWANSSEFLLSASREMRRVLLDHARRANSVKRRGGMVVELAGELPAPELNLPLSLEIDQALAALGEEAPRAVRIVELHFFGGLRFEEIAQVLEISTKTIAREWAWARAWLFRRLSQPACSTLAGDDLTPA